MQKPYIALSRRAKSFKDYRKGKSPCSEAGGLMEGWVEMPASRRTKYIRRPARVVLNLERRSTQDFTVAQKQATVLVDTPNGGNEDVLLLF